MKPEIKVKITIKNVEVELSLDEVKELGDVLQKLIGVKDTIYIPTYPSYPRPYWSPWTPYWSDTTGMYRVSYCTATGENE